MPTSVQRLGWARNVNWVSGADPLPGRRQAPTPGLGCPLCWAGEGHTADFGGCGVPPQPWTWATAPVLDTHLSDAQDKQGLSGLSQPWNQAPAHTGQAGRRCGGCTSPAGQHEWPCQAWTWPAEGRSQISPCWAGKNRQQGRKHKGPTRQWEVTSGLRATEGYEWRSSAQMRMLAPRTPIFAVSRSLKTPQQAAHAAPTSGFLTAPSRTGKQGSMGQWLTRARTPWCQEVRTRSEQTPVNTSAHVGVSGARGPLTRPRAKTSAEPKTGVDYNPKCATTQGRADGPTEHERGSDKPLIQNPSE